MTLDNLRIAMRDEPTFAQLSGCSHPFTPIDLPFVEAAHVRMARHVVGAFVSRYGGMLGSRGSADLAGVFERWLTVPATREDVWDDAFGQVRACLTGPLGDVLVPESAAALGSRLCATGMAAQFEISLDRRSRHLFASWLLPSASKLRFESDGADVSITLSGGSADGTLRFHRHGEAWDLASHDVDAALSPLPLPHVERKGGRVQLLQRDALFPLAMGDIESMVPEVVDDDVCASIQEAYSILRDHAPIYADWVGRFSRRVVPLRTPPGLMMSSSSIYRPGTITMSHNAHPFGMAEILVHENTHEHLHLASACGPLDDGSDTNLYYSPIRKIDRPLSAVLVAYHAVGNIALFYRECRRWGAPGADYLDVSEPEAKGWLVEMEKTLDKSRALTTFGRALYEPLRDELR